jgi:hypothetical protein
MKNKKVWLIVGVGALGLYAFYRYRKGLSIFPSLGGLLAGQGTAGSGTANTGFTGQTNLPQVPAQTMSEDERIRLRNAATGPGSRGQCIFPRRWIDTQTAPYYGLCVDQATFTRWLNMGNVTNPLLGNNQPTLDFVRRALGI